MSPLAFCRQSARLAIETGGVRALPFWPRTSSARLMRRLAVPPLHELAEQGFTLIRAHVCPSRASRPQKGVELGSRRCRLCIEALEHVVGDAPARPARHGGGEI